MGRKRKFSKLLLFAAMVSTIGAGILGSVPLPVKAAEEEDTYTVRFEAYEGTCETESVTFPKGESIILPDASYEGHYLMNWIDAIETGENEITFLSVGAAGWEYTPERDMWLYANWKPDQEQNIMVIYEARIGDTSYEELEEAFANAHAGGTICYMNETGIILSGNIVMEDNLAVGVESCDIHYFYNTGASILLDGDFESDSIFVLGGYDSIKPGRVLIDGTLYHKDASPEQFPWHCPNYCTEKRGENLYLAEVPKTYYAAWERSEATVTFDAGGGKMEGGDITAKRGDAITHPNCTKEGYEFTGWYDGDTCVGQAGIYRNRGKDTSDKNQNTSGTVSGNSAGSPSDKNTDTNIRTEGGNGNAGKGTEPVSRLVMCHPLFFLLPLGCAALCLLLHLCLKGRRERSAACSGCVL